MIFQNDESNNCDMTITCSVFCGKMESKKQIKNTLLTRILYLSSFSVGELLPIKTGLLTGYFVWFLMQATCLLLDVAMRFNDVMDF